MITPLNNGHSAEIIALILPIQQIEFGVPVTLQQQQDLLDIEKHYSGTGGNFWGAYADGLLVGTIGLIAVGHEAGVIRKMFVRKEFRGKKYRIAQQLLETLLIFCGHEGIEALYLGTVEILKAAHRFYERNGFRRIEAAKLPSYFPRMQVDNVFYQLAIESKVDR